ncbi:hypothetical protein HC031_12920 [Planosporangium thailandense]|uniref:CBM6 domain-containing protein n=1 Tax=Planosporangium thailandense TaxID=765197 RepID=A0ABX0XZM5_9ACTN|nr:hypothetical protein [Planosporangium thailandense]NJC70609.1 hypothetical protein [Planosporangium thailandense]
MTVGREAATWIAALGYRGQHTGRGRRRHAATDRTQTILLGSAGVAVAVVTTAAVLPLSWHETAHFTPVPARMSTLPLQPVPRAESGPPPGVPTAVTTAGTTIPTRASTAPRTTTSAFPSAPAASQTTRPPAHPPVVPVSYEAEAASNVLSGDAHIRAAAGASGGEVVTSIGGAPANALQFNRVTVPFDGIYTLVIRYISAGDRTANISVNGSRTVSLGFPSTNDLETLGLLALRVKLVHGDNSIGVGNPAAKAPDIDQIVVGS